MTDPAFRAMMKRPPALPDNLRHGDPWQLWAYVGEGRWRTGLFATYADVWAAFVKRFRDPETYLDLAIVSRRMFVPPPDRMHWSPLFDWCPRCRRPTIFRNYPTSHHALRMMPVLSDDDPYHCYYCGIRRVAVPTYAQRSM